MYNRSGVNKIYNPGLSLAKKIWPDLWKISVKSKVTIQEVKLFLEKKIKNDVVQRAFLFFSMQKNTIHTLNLTFCLLVSNPP